MRCPIVSILSVAALLSCGGCMVAPIFSDFDTSTVDKDMNQLQADRMERLRANKNVNQAEYQALDARSGTASGLPPKPSIEELEKQVEADKQAR